MTDFATLDPNGTCKSCGAPVRWVAFVSGKRNPLDLRPHEDGNVVLGAAVDENGNAVARVLTRSEAQARVGARYRSHFSSCPNASEHRR